MATASGTASQRTLVIGFVAGLLVGVGAIWPGVRDIIAGVEFAGQSLGPAGGLLAMAIVLTLASGFGIGVIYYFL